MLERFSECATSEELFQDENTSLSTICGDREVVLDKVV